jgi:5-methylcytosine-specific restriction protein A
MAQSGMSFCASPGCPELVEHHTRYCVTHAPDNRDRRGSSTGRGYGYRWQRLRAMALSRHPLCADPDRRHPDQLVPATDVHHVIPKRQGGLDVLRNLQCLCHACHSAITARGG